MRGDRALEAHREHYYQRMVLMGLAPRRMDGVHRDGRVCQCQRGASRAPDAVAAGESRFRC